MVLGLFAQAPVAQADPIINYSATGNVDNSGITGAGPIINFANITNNSFNSPSHFSLGDFSVTALNAGQSSTYHNTPFEITLVVNSVDGVTPNPNQTPITVTGVLNGTVTGNDQSSVTATYNTISNGTFTTGNWSNTLSVTDNPQSLVPFTTNGGLTSAQSLISSTMLSGSGSSGSGSSGSGSSGSGSSGSGSGSGSGAGETLVPEPSTIAMFLTTLAGLGVHQARRRRGA
jgi:hypothetical protein